MQIYWIQLHSCLFTHSLLVPLKVCMCFLSSCEKQKKNVLNTTHKSLRHLSPNKFKVNMTDMTMKVG